MWVRWLWSAKNVILKGIVVFERRRVAWRAWAIREKHGSEDPPLQRGERAAGLKPPTYNGEEKSCR
jgi:hypothetical protein